MCLSLLSLLRDLAPVPCSFSGSYSCSCLVCCSCSCPCSCSRSCSCACSFFLLFRKVSLSFHQGAFNKRGKRLAQQQLSWVKRLLSTTSCVDLGSAPRGLCWGAEVAIAAGHAQSTPIKPCTKKTARTAFTGAMRIPY